ncbi:hypothetical protein SAMN05216466_101688 [Paraburkholderia phenazinium]|jgi:hypothetical protein|uniref:Uncharacterized protein n=2 Tax=Paraburkholderia phenazinium TaxID=60549 RepID=A0A1G7QB44_9BURK|nr:hypothetical protein SAMN05216466_101688 [Paraburkholderia phenazinium]
MVLRRPRYGVTPEPSEHARAANPVSLSDQVANTSLRLDVAALALDEKLDGALQFA